MKLFVCILTALLLSVLGLNIPKAQKLHEDIQLEKKEGYYIYTTKKICAVSTCSNEPVRYSRCLKGHLPRGIRMYGFSKGFCFRFNNRNEVMIIPKLTEKEPLKTPQTVSLLELETGQYCMDNYDSLCPDYTLFDRFFFTKAQVPYRPYCLYSSRRYCRYLCYCQKRKYDRNAFNHYFRVQGN